MKKIILNLDESTLEVKDNKGASIGFMTNTGAFDTVNTAGDLTLQLVKQGVAVDEIVKLKNADLI